MKSKRWFAPIGVLAFLLLCFVPNGQAQCAQVSQPASAPWQLGLQCKFNASSSPVNIGYVPSLTYWQIFFVPSGTVSAASLSVDSSTTGLASSWSTGGIIPAATIGSLTSAGTYANSSATAPTNFAQLTPSITGSGSVTVVIFGYINNPQSSSSIAGSVSVSNFPATQNTNLTQVGGASLSLYATLINAQAATGTYTGSAIRLPGYAASGVLVITGSGITGSPSGCQIALEQQQNTGAPAGSAYATQAFTPGNSYQSFQIVPTAATAAADTVVPVFTCTTYPTAGAITVTFETVPTILVELAGQTLNKLDSTQGGTQPAGVLSVAGNTETSGTNGTVGSNNVAARPLMDRTGNAFVIPGGSNRISGFTTFSTNTTTQIQNFGAPGANLFIFVTGVVLNTRTAGSATTIQIEFGTGTNCATVTGTLSPTIANTAVGQIQFQFPTPLVPTTANTEICAVQAGTTAGTTDVWLVGYVAP